MVLGNFSSVIKATGEVWTWGLNSLGQLADGSIIDRSSPVLVIGNHSFKTLSLLGSQRLSSANMPIYFRDVAL